MIRGVFVTATGTDVGKTVTTTGIVRWLLRRSVDCMVMKPVQTGAIAGSDGALVAPDIETVLQATGLRPDAATRARMAPFLYAPACSPHLATRIATRPAATVGSIVDHARWLAARHRTLVVEGAGGVMVPLGDSELMVDLMRALGLPVVLVADSALGTINHVLLSLEALRQRQVQVLGVVLNDTRPPTPSDAFIRDDNERAVASFGRVRVISRIPFLGSPPHLLRLDAALSGCDFSSEVLP